MENRKCMNLTKRLLWAASVNLVFLIIYFGTQYIAMHFSKITDVKLLLPGEERIPFLPEFIIIYCLYYFLPIWLFIEITRRGRILKMALVFMVAAAIHALIFVFMPVEYVLRPEMPIGSVLHDFMTLLYKIDAPINTFPSMHVSFVFIVYFLVRRYRPQYRSLFFFLAIIISASTLFVKQHYILDIASGILLATLINYFIISRKITVAKLS